MQRISPSEMQTEIFIDVKRIDGNLVIDDSDPEKDTWLFELNYSPSELTKQKNVKVELAFLQKMRYFSFEND